MKRFGVIAVLALMCAAASGALQTQAPIPYYVQDGKGIAGYESGDRELAGFAFDAWSRESGGRLNFVRAERESNALVQVRWVDSGEGRFGETERILVDGKVGAAAYISLPVNLSEPLATMVARDHLLRDTIVYLTCVHELGHAVGLGHTRDFQDIMYSFQFGGDIPAYFNRYRNKLKSRADIAKFSGLSANDIAVLKTLY